MPVDGWFCSILILRMVFTALDTTKVIPHRFALWGHVMAATDSFSRRLADYKKWRNELSATMFIEITDQEAVRSELDRLIGVNERLRLRIGERHVVPGVFEPGWSREDRVAAVQYVKFPLTPEQAEAFKDGRESVFIGVDHPAYQASTQIDEATRQTLARELN